MPKYHAIIGTDTDCGKTYATCQLLTYFKNKGLTAAALKPIATGVDNLNQNLDNNLLFAQASYKLDYHWINAFLFKDACSPNIAAKKANVDLTASATFNKVQKTLANIKSNVVLCEGIGGIMTPLNDHETYVDFLKLLNIPIILVVGLKLGALNHSLLTKELLVTHNLKVTGFIINQIDPNLLYLAENIAYLKANLNLVYLGSISYQGKFNPQGETLLCN